MDFQWISPALFAAFAQEATDAHRLCSGREGWAERLGPDVLLSCKHDAAQAALHAGLRAWEEACAWRHERLFIRSLPRENARRTAPVLLEGAADIPLTGVVRENAVRFGIDFGAGYAAGLFLDQRHNRAFLRLRARAPMRLLNTFAYTCSFSVAAALAGAETWSVDLSKKSLERGKENFALNELGLEGHRFFAEDVMELLPRLARRGERFEVIVLDPPTFSRGAHGRLWQAEHGLEALLLAALELAAPGGALLLATNSSRIGRRELERLARFCLKTQRRAATLHSEPALPDFPASGGPLAGGNTAAASLWILLD